MSEGNGLPTGWAEATVGALCGFITSGSRGWASHYSEEGSIFLRIGNLDHESISLDMRSIQCVRPPAGAESDRTRVESQDILVSVTADVGMIGVVPNSFGTAYINQHIALCRPLKGCYSPYIAWFLTSRRGQKQFKDMQRGATKVGLGLDDVRNATVPIAPLPEQHRIVEKIEELFSDLDAGVSALERAKANLKRYRASVLKSAVEGRLTEDWRKGHPQSEDGQMLLDRILRERREKWEKDQLAQFKKKGKEPPKNWQNKYEEPSAPDTSELPDLPEGWVWARVEQLGDVQLGRQRSPKNRSDKYPTKYIRSANLTETGLDLGDVMDMEFLPHEKETYRLHAGDILLAEASGSPDQVGKPVVWNNEIDDCCFQNTVIRLRPHGLPSAFPFLVFRQYYISKLFAKVSAGVGINHLSANKFSALSFPLPSLSEQEQIVALVEERLSQIDSAEKTINAELIRSKRLRQSILKRAFEGQLVPQDPKEEPASVLLERIKASKEQEQPKKAKKATAK